MLAPRRLPLSGVLFLLLVLTSLARLAVATKPQLPPVGELALKLEKSSGRLLLTAAEELGEVTIEIYGLDGLRVGRGDEDLVWVRLAQLRKGEKVTIPFSLQQGAGRTGLVVRASAAGRMSELSQSLGELSAEQLRERSACVRKDPEGNYIKLMGCEEEGKAPRLPAPRAIRSVEVARLPAAAAAPLGQQLRIDGDEVELTLARPLYQNPKCQSQPRLSAKLKRDGQSQQASWQLFEDASCRAPVEVRITVLRLG